MTLAGIDVSAVGQGGSFNWSAWKGKIQFAGIKISEGTTYADPDAARNIAGGRSVGAAVMGYHFLHAGESGAAQADASMSHCKTAKLERGDLLAVDVEQGGLDGESAAALWAAAADFVTTIRGHYGCWPVVYTNISLAESAGSAVGNCPLWLANPSQTAVTSIGPWGVISFEQTGQSGVDLDVFYGDLAALKLLAIPE
jgi:GH25 family lysozyme M1 (1,4-beta-N-acetylmuramidase)